MTQEERQILLVDLCARFPYGVIVHIHDIDVDDYDRQLIGEDLDFIELYRRNCKPYLRPMSSMTEEEKVEYCYLQDKFLLSSQYPVTDGYALFDYLNKNMFDYRGLIKKGLAIEVTEENNPYEK